MTLKIQTWYNNPILRKISDEIVDFKDAKKIEKEMKDFLNNEENWVGLAGPQVWIMKRIFIAQFDKKRNTTVVNPKIIDFWSKKTISQEWCLSLFWVWADVERSKNITVEFFNTKWEKKTLKLTWFASLVFQHELDHLDGILFIDRATWENISIDNWVDLKKLQLDKVLVF